MQIQLPSWSFLIFIPEKLPFIYFLYQLFSMTRSKKKIKKYPYVHVKRTRIRGF